MAPRPLVIGLTGSTRSGKSWVARLLCERLDLPSECVVGQDSFWCRAVRVRTPDGEDMVSEEEPDCTDHGAFADAIQRAADQAVAAFQGCLIAEGFQLVHDEQVPRLLDHIFFLDLGREACIARRSAKRGPMNPNPMSLKKCEALVWPAHERYVEQKVKPLGKCVHWLRSPTSPEEAAAIVETICTVAGLGDAGAEASESTALLAEPPQVAARPPAPVPEAGRPAAQAAAQPPAPAPEAGRRSAQVPAQPPAPVPEAGKHSTQVEAQPPAPVPEAGTPAVQIPVQPPAPVPEAGTPAVQAVAQPPAPVPQAGRPCVQVESQSPAAASVPSKPPRQARPQHPGISTRIGRFLMCGCLS